jgi:hypothetical protein
MSKQTPVKGKQSRNSRHDPRARKARQAEREAWKLLTPEEIMERVRAAFNTLPPIGKAPHATH